MYSISDDLILLNHKIIVPDKTNFFFNTWVISFLKHEEKSKILFQYYIFFVNLIIVRKNTKIRIK